MENQEYGGPRAAQREKIHHTPDIFVLFSGVVDPTCIGGNHLNSIQMLIFSRDTLTEHIQKFSFTSYLGMP